ncbi:MAG TPA: hypothetical protein VJB14_08605 [Planctomycetota bacterium]|nr:hypothetical protein [Planctomycetota bacterium]
MIRPAIFGVLLASCATAAPDPNAAVLDTLRRYPTDGTYSYFWPKEGPWDGTTEAIDVDGVRLTQGDPQKRSYCCGLTYEVFLKARRALGDPDAAAPLKELKLRWYGNSREAPERRRLVAFAIESMGYGSRVAALEDARPGDFVQFWRHGGSGHSAIFIDWLREGGRIVGITYWSSQKSTNGIGTATERIGDTQGVKRDEIYLARLTSGKAR